MVVRGAGLLWVLLGLASPAASEGCGLALVLAIDVSASVDEEEDLLQRTGLAHALLAPEVKDAFLMGAPVALHVFEWSSNSSQVPLLDGWRLIESEADLIRAAHVIGTSRKHDIDQLHPSTGMGRALAYADRAFETAPPCRRRVVDVSSDGYSNEGPDPEVVYASGLLDGVTVNALIIGGPLGGQLLLDYYEEEVLHGPDAFWVLAEDYEDYARAMRRKLLRELHEPVAVRIAPASPAGGSGAGRDDRAAVPAPRPDYTRAPWTHPAKLLSGVRFRDRRLRGRCLHISTACPPRLSDARRERHPH